MSALRTCYQESNIILFLRDLPLCCQLRWCSAVQSLVGCAGRTTYCAQTSTWTNVRVSSVNSRTPIMWVCDCVEQGPEWKQDDHCLSNEAYMDRFCRFTCGKCKWVNYCMNWRQHAQETGDPMCGGYTTLFPYISCCGILRYLNAVRFANIITYRMYCISSPTHRMALSAQASSPGARQTRWCRSDWTTPREEVAGGPESQCSWTCYGETRAQT